MKTCYEICESKGSRCENKVCRYWVDGGSANCTILTSQKGPMSLQEIGDIMGVTRMRICQIEKRVAKKIRSLIGD